MRKSRPVASLLSRSELCSATGGESQNEGLECRMYSGVYRTREEKFCGEGSEKNRNIRGTKFESLPANQKANCIYNTPLANNPITNIPKKFSVNDIGINTDVFIFESPIIARPISSGNGEATIRAPINGTIHLNRFR